MGGNLQGRGKILHSYVYDLVGVFFLLLLLWFWALAREQFSSRRPSTFQTWSSDNWSERDKDVKTLARRMSQHIKRMSVTVRPTAHLPSSPEAARWRPEVVAEGHDAADCTAAYRSSIFNSVPIVLAQFCTFIAQQLRGPRSFFFPRLFAGVKVWYFHSFPPLVAVITVIIR